MLEAMSARGVRVIGVQPEANCAMRESLSLGRALTVYEGRATICEGLEGPVAERTFRVAAQHGLRIETVSEAAIRAAVGFAYRALGLIVEPSAAVGIAAVREGRIAVSSATVVVITGSNIEPELLDGILAAEQGLVSDGAGPAGAALR
jgi:threonine dehydratase